MSLEVYTEPDVPNVAGVSEGGVQFYVYHPVSSNLWQIKKDKGQLPEELQGSYTTKDSAIKAVDFYLSNRVRLKQDSKSRAARRESGKSV